MVMRMTPQKGQQSVTQSNGGRALCLPLTFDISTSTRTFLQLGQLFTPASHTRGLHHFGDHIYLLQVQGPELRPAPWTLTSHGRSVLHGHQMIGNLLRAAAFPQHPAGEFLATAGDTAIVAQT